MSRHYPFRLTILAFAVFALLAPAGVVPLHAQVAQQAALSNSGKAQAETQVQAQAEAAKPAAPAASGSATTGTSPATGSAAAADPAAQKGHGRPGDRQGQGSREIGERYLQPRAMPVAEGRCQIDGLAAACREQADRGPAGRDHRLRFVLDRWLRRVVTRVQISQPARCTTAPEISQRRHHGRQSRQGRRGRAGNDEAVADRSDRHASGHGDLAGRHQRGAAQSRSGRDRQPGRARRQADSGSGRAPTSCWSIRNIRRAVNEHPESTGKMVSCSAGSPNCVTSASSRASR